LSRGTAASAEPAAIIGNASMDAMVIAGGDWVLVADGRKALLLRNEGDAIHPRLALQTVREHRQPPDRELHADRPGRVHQSAAPARSAVEVDDRHARAECGFIAATVAMVDRFVARAPQSRLIVVAPPRALGTMRAFYTPALRKALRVEMEGDWVRLPAEDILRRLRRSGDDGH
jgi:protein required for attachment to host cells